MSGPERVPYADAMRLRLLAVPLTALALALLAGCGASPDASSTATPSATSTTADGTCQYLPSGESAVAGVEAPPETPDAAASAVLQTSVGDISIAFDTPTPCTIGSFASLAEQGYFDGTQCHRLTTEGIFVLQCGDPSATGRGGPGYSFADELDGSETYPAGTVAMANAGPDTNGSQFFLVYEETPLPASYTVFGHMDAAGIQTVADVAAAGTDTGEPDGAPATPVEITAVTID